MSRGESPSHGRTPSGARGPTPPGALDEAKAPPSAGSQVNAGTPLVAGQDFPRAFGAYVLLEAIGQGGMGEVYLAMHGGIEGIERLCVLKRLKPELTGEASYRRRFIDEARIVVQLNHPGICHVFDVGRVGEEYYLAMEHIPGINLRTLLDRLAPRSLPPGAALHLVGEVLDALFAAHRHTHPATGAPVHLVHRDVSPQNVMVTVDGGAKLIDFGLALSDIKVEHTESHVVMGKVAYMAPEQARGDAVDGGVDQFATAVIACELLLGERFYGAMKTHAIWQVVGQGGHRPAGFATLPPALQAILDRALAPDPALRFPSCEGLREALEDHAVRHHPGAHRRALREIAGELMKDDVARQRALLARFADHAAGPPPGPVPPLPGMSLVEATPVSMPSRRGEQVASQRTLVVARPAKPVPPPPGRRVGVVVAAALAVVGLAVAGQVLLAPAARPPVPAPEVAAVAVPGLVEPAVPAVAAPVAVVTPSPPPSPPPSSTPSAPRVPDDGAARLTRERKLYAHQRDVLLACTLDDEGTRTYRGYVKAHAELPSDANVKAMLPVFVEKCQAARKQ